MTLRVCIFTVLIIASIATSQTQVTDSTSVLKQYYVGGLFTLTPKNEASDKLTSEMTIRIGGIFRFPVHDNIYTQARFFYEPVLQIFSPDVRFVWAFSGQNNISAGFLPTVVRMAFTPNPVSDLSHFLRPAKKVISTKDSKIGVIANLTDIGLSAAIYSMAKDSLEIHLAKTISFSGGYFVTAGCYYAPKHTSLLGQPLFGTGMKLRKDKFEITAFYCNSRKSQTASTFINIPVWEDWEVYNSSVCSGKQLKTTAAKNWQEEVGLFKTFTAPIVGHLSKYRLGAGYEFQPIAIGHLYIQIWI